MNEDDAGIGLPFRLAGASPPGDGAHAAAQRVIGFLQDGSATTVDAAVWRLARPVLIVSFFWRFFHSACVLAAPPLVYGLLR